MEAAPYYLVKPWPAPSTDAVQALLNDMHGQGYSLVCSITDGKAFFLVFKRGG